MVAKSGRRTAMEVQRRRCRDLWRAAMARTEVAASQNRRKSRVTGRKMAAAVPLQ